MARGVSIRTALSAVVVLLILVAALGTGGAAWVGTRDTLEQSWRQSAADMAERTVQQVQRVLSPAAPVTGQAAAWERHGGATHPDALLPWMLTALTANPEMTWLARADAQGTYVGVAQWPDGEGVVLRSTVRHAGGQRLDHELRDGEWVLVLDETHSDYDPRVRPFWVGLGDEGAWFDPYVFLSRQQVGVSYAQPVRDDEGALRAVWVADFECAPLAEFLATVRVGETGRVYLLDESGQVIAHPAGDVVDEGQLAHALNHPDPWLREAWPRVTQASGHTVAFDGLLAAAHPFPEESGVPWWVLIVVPEQELYGAAGTQALASLALTVVLLALATVLGTLLSRRISTAVSRVSDQMDRIARFDLDDSRLALGSPPIRELRALAVAHDHMKGGLRSFERYVPRGLARSVLEGGEQAEVGGLQQPASVLFLTFTDFGDRARSLQPQELIRDLSGLLEGVDRAIAAQQGRVTQYLGDTSMAVWSEQDHALRACRAALQALEGLGGRPATAAVNTGICLVGNIGAVDRFAYSVLGDPVNTAARINGLNAVYGTSLVIGQGTAGLVRELLLLRPVDWVRMKGKTQPVLVFEVLGEREAASEQQQAQVLRHEEALAAYREGRFAEAAEAFEAGPWAHPLAARARGYVANPPGPGWDGVHAMRTK